MYDGREQAYCEGYQQPTGRLGRTVVRKRRGSNINRLGGWRNREPSGRRHHDGNGGEAKMRVEVSEAEDEDAIAQGSVIIDDRLKSRKGCRYSLAGSA